jgi:glycosyltransferase involved in cell wall biosynthesis
VPIVAHLVKTQAIAGAENHLFKLLPALVRNGWDVHLINIYDRAKGEGATAAYDVALERIRPQGVRIERVEVANKFDPLGSLRLARVIRRIRPSVVHTHLPYADLFGSIGARMAGVRIVLSSRHRDYSMSPQETRRFRRYYRFVNPLQDAVIAISHRIAALCRNEEHRDPRTIHTVWYGCEEQVVSRQEARAALRNELGVPAGALLLGTVGRLIPLKGHQYAIDALAMLRDVMPTDAVWVVVGAGPECQALQERAVALGIGDRVKFIGQRDDVPRIVAALDVLVHPTTAEGFGLVLLEAMIQSTPIVATEVGALPEIIIHGQSGVLVPPRNPSALADAIRRMLSDRGERERFGRAGRERYESCFRLERMVGETLDVYRRVTRDA